MKKERFLSLFPMRKPIIAMVHLGELAGQKGFVSENAVVEAALDDIYKLQKGGVSALLLENWKETSMVPTIPRQRRASMARVVSALRPHITIPWGINVLNLDYEAAYEIAAQNGASFIQLDTLVDRVQSDFQFNEAAKKHPFIVDIDIPHLRQVAKRYKRSRLPILAGVHPKHFTMLDEKKTLEQSARQSHRRGVGGIVITKATGQAPLKEAFVRVRAVVPTPLVIGSGMDAGNATDLLSVADGAIVGTYLKQGGNTDNPVDLDRVKQLMDVVHKVEKL